MTMDGQLLTILYGLLAAAVGYYICYFICSLVISVFTSSLVAKWLTHGLLVSVLIGSALFMFASHYVDALQSMPVVGTLFGVVVALNLVVTPFYYWTDKRLSSKAGASRIPENVLHTWALFGAGLSAIISQRVFHHKTKKKRFQIITALAMLSTLCIYYLFYLIGTNQLTLL